MSSSISKIERSGRLGSSESSTSIPRETVRPNPRLQRQNTTITDNLWTSLQDADFMQLMRACSKHGIPSFHLRNPKMTEVEQPGRTITLGSGLTSAVVQYKMTEGDPVSEPTGRIVALKTFRRREHSQVDRQAVYESIMGEMEVLCHPLIAGHPNIVQLYFIGWRKDEAFPGLALEHGAHGSLDHIMRGSWTGLSHLQTHRIRQHITLDILMGLHAIHKAGFVHGDLKPGNILVMSHPDERRQVVAKITDFGGSSRLAGNEGGRPRHYTPLWCAPEVLNQDPDIDWEKADLYAYALIVGSLWASDPGRVSLEIHGHNDLKLCFLSSFVHSGMSKEEVETIMWAIKSQQDEQSEDSISSCFKVRLDRTVPDEVDRKELLDLLGPVLQAHFWRRPSTQELGWNAQNIASHIGRDTGDEMEIMAETHARGRFEKQPGGPFAWSRSFEYVSIIEDQATIALSAITSPGQNLELQDDLPDTIPDDMEPDEYLSMIAEILRKLMVGNHGQFDSNFEARFEKNRVRGALAWFVALSSLSHSKSPSHAEKFEDMAWTSAVSGYKKAIEFASLALHGTHKEMRLPLRCFLSLFALSQSMRASELLHNLWPAHYTMVQSIIARKPSACKQCEALIIPDGYEFMMNVLLVYREEPFMNGQFTLKQALELGLAQVIREALDGTVVPDDFHESVVGLLHSLSNLPDSEAAALGPRAYQRGAKLSFLAEVGVSVAEWDGSANEGSSTPRKLSPLAAAIRRGKCKLALVILDLHAKHDAEPIVDFRQAFALSCAYQQYAIADQLLRLYRSSPHICYEGGQQSNLPESLFSELLFNLESPVTVLDHFEARLLHGRRYDFSYERILGLLLENGANPLDDFGTSSALIACMINDNVTAMKLFINALESRDINAFDHLKDPKNLNRRPGHSYSINALAICIEMNSLRLFQYLLQRYPLPSWEAAEGDFVTTALHDACAKRGRTPFVQTLLQYQPDFAAKDETGQIPITVALSKGNIEVADAISSRCSGEMLRELGCRDPDNGWSVFFSLLSEWRRQRSPEMIESFQWLKKMDWIHRKGPEDKPFWWWILDSPGAAPTKVEQRLDVALFTLLLRIDTLTTGLSTEMIMGRNILHHAIQNGHVQLVKLLLDEGIDHNIRMDAVGDISEGFAFPAEAARIKRDGVSTLDMAFTLATRLGIPPHIAQAGYFEAQEWLDNVEKIKDLLIEKGVRGKILDYFESKVRQASRESVLDGMVVNTLQESTAANVGSWPKPLGDRPTVPLVTPLNMQDASNSRQAQDELMFDLFRPSIRQRQADIRREAEQKATPPDYLQKIKRMAKLRKYEWRLPPDWYCLIVTEDETQSGGCSALYANRKTGTCTRERPELYRGGHEARSDEIKGKGKATEGFGEDIYNATPVMQPQEIAPDVLDVTSLSLESPQIPPDFELGTQHLEGQIPSSSRPDDSRPSRLVESGTTSLNPGFIASGEGIVIQVPPDFARLTFEDGSTMLHSFAGLGALETLSLVLEQDMIPIDAERHDGYTPLHAAVDANKLDALALLMAYGADSNRTFPSRGHRPIHHSAMQDSANMANVLLQGNTDVKATTVEGYAPLHFCVSVGGRVDIMETLIKAGADVNAVGPEGTVLWMAVNSRHDSAASVDMLLNAGARTNADENLLDAAAATGSIRITKALLDQGFDVNQGDSHSRTPIIAAIVYQHMEIFKLLCERGADISVIHEFRFFLRPRSDGKLDRLAFHVGKGNDLSAEELNRALGVDDGGWQKWEPVRIIERGETEAS